MRRKIFIKIPFVILASLTLLQTGCDTTEPKRNNAEPGRRDYVWTVDTLNYPYSPLYRLWGSSPSNLWAISTGDWDKSISHFNGEEWDSYGVPGLNLPSSIYGFSEDNIFVGTLNSEIWHYDGNDWNKFAELNDGKQKNIVFDNMWGLSADNFFATGAFNNEDGLPNNSVIANYKSNSWSIFNTDEIIGIVERLYTNKLDDEIYLRTNRLGGGEHYDSTLIYKYKNGKYTKLYGSIWNKGSQADLSRINGKVYFILGDKIAIREANKFKTILQVDNPNFYQRIWGRHINDLFLMMVDGLAHYNGKNIEYLFNYPYQTQIFGAELYKNEIFFLVYESKSNLNLIYHGILKEGE